MVPDGILAEKKANQITPDDIVNVLRRMITNDVTTTTNRVRSYLNTAFVNGLKSDHNPRDQISHGKKFHLSVNPVSAVPNQPDYERVGERKLSNHEVRGLWHDFQTVMSKVSPMYGLLMKFMLATAGNRPEQLACIEWENVDFEERTFTFLNRKKVKGQNKEVFWKEKMPMTDRSERILRQAWEISGQYDLVFTIGGRSPISDSRLSNYFQRYCLHLEKEALKNGSTIPEPFTPRDIRRTATNILLDNGFSREHRYLIQSRSEGGVEEKHYNRSDRILEKRKVIERYDPESVIS